VEEYNAAELEEVVQPKHPKDDARMDHGDPIEPLRVSFGLDQILSR
jgi:hypothetical protein